MKNLSFIFLSVLFILAFMALNSCKKENEPAPIASFTAPDSGYLDQPILFTSTSLNAKSISWNFCDGSSSHDNPVTHTFKSYRVYNVNLTASNSSENNTCSKELTIINGYSEYKIVNSSSIGAILCSCYLDQEYFIHDLYYVGYIISGSSSGLFPTKRSELHIGARIGSLYLISVKAYKIEKFNRNQLNLYDTTLMYSSKKANPFIQKIEKSMLKDFLRETTAETRLSNK